MPKGTLYLVPSGLGATDVKALLAPATLAVIAHLHYFVAENPKSARAFLKAVGYPRPIQDVRIDILDEHTPESGLEGLLQPLEQGADCGLLSEAGCPAVADPGAALVRRGHAAHIQVVPLVGPSALLLALMASGMNGQQFAFHGYLPVDRGARAKRLVELESEAEKRRSTQIFIEAPYRNEALFDAIMDACRDDTLLCLATDLTLETEAIRMQAVSQWRMSRPRLNRRPTVFLLYRDTARPRQKR